MGNPTLKTIAEEAGVSIATASLVLNDKGNISQDVRQKIYGIAQKLGYIKPIYGSPIATQHINHLAILLHEDYDRAFLWNFIREMMVQLEAAIGRQQFFPVIIPINNNQPIPTIVQKVVVSKAAGVFSIHYGNAELFQQLETQGIPVVVINNSAFQNQFYAVCVDDFQGAYEGARHLISLGHRRIGYIEYEKPDVQACVEDRFIGFKKAIDEHRLAFDDKERITVGLHDIETLQQKLGMLLQKEEPPTALFVHDDYQAAQVIVLLQHMNITVPDDVSIIAPGDTLDFSLVFTPRITTMQINTGRMGKLAGEMMLERLESSDEEAHVLKVTQRLVKRGSCKQLSENSPRSS